MCSDGDVTSTSRWRRPLMIGGPAILGLMVIIVLSLTGEATTAGAPRSDTKYLTDSFRQPGRFDQSKQGGFGWTVLEGMWFSDGIGVSAQDVPARLQGSPGAEPPRALVVRYDGSPSGSELILHWWPAESWGVRFSGEEAELVRSVDGKVDAIQTSPMVAESLASPTITMEPSDRSVVVSVDGEVLFETPTADAATGATIELVATDQAVTFDRVEAEVSR